MVNLPNGVEFNLAIDDPFSVPDEKFFSSSVRLYGHVYRKYQEHPDYFFDPMPERGDAKALIKADCIYYQKEYGRKHHNWEYFITQKGLIFKLGFSQSVLLEPLFFRRGSEFREETLLIDAYRTARQARFEHGEMP